MMTLKQFDVKLQTLCKEAEASGLDVEDMSQILEDLAAFGWGEKEPVDEHKP